MLAIEGLKVGTHFLAAYAERKTPVTFTEYKIIAFSKVGVQLEKVHSDNTYDNKIQWYSTDKFGEEYDIMEILKN